MVLRRRNPDNPPQLQHRLLLAMSVFDIIGSTGWAFTTGPIPRGAKCAFGAVGNKATCVAQGVMITLGLTVPMYNCMLCVYYLLVIKYDTRDEVIDKYEIPMHLICICLPLMASIIAAVNDLFNSHRTMCWIVESDHYELNDHTQDNILVSVLYIVTIVCFILVLLVIGYCMINIYKFVKHKELLMRTYQFRRPDRSITSLVESTTSTVSSSRLSNTASDTKKQAFLYVGSFVLSYLFPTVNLVNEGLLLQNSSYVLLLLQGMFTPLQGFWNFLVYIRPRFNIISRQHGEINIFRRVFMTVFLKHEPSTQPSRRRSFAGRRRHSL